MASAMMERAEFPVHRNKTLYLTGMAIRPYGYPDMWRMIRFDTIHIR
jgi:hypothetical protein